MVVGRWKEVVRGLEFEIVTRWRGGEDGPASRVERSRSQILDPTDKTSQVGGVGAKIE